MPRQRSAPPRSRSRNISSPMRSQRPERLPHLAREEGREQELLGADLVHLVADDARHLLAAPPPEGEQRVEARRELAHEAAAHQQLVAHRLGVGRVVAQRRDEGLGPAHPARVALDLEEGRPRATGTGVEGLAEALGERSGTAPDAAPIEGARRGRCGPRCRSGTPRRRRAGPSARGCIRRPRCRARGPARAPSRRVIPGERTVGAAAASRGGRRGLRTRSQRWPRPPFPGCSAAAPRRRRARRASSFASALFR